MTSPSSPGQETSPAHRPHPDLREPAFRKQFAHRFGAWQAVPGHHVPDLAVGRLSARSDAELDVVLDKILIYQQSPPTGNWRKHALTIADRGKNFNVQRGRRLRDGERERPRDLETTAAHLVRAALLDRLLRRADRGVLTTTATEAMRSDIKAAVNGTGAFAGFGGVAIQQFNGHGNFDVWSAEAFFDNRSPAFDTDDLVNGGRLPVLLVHNCLTGGFMGTGTRTLGEDWQKKSAGGAVAGEGPKRPSISTLRKHITCISVIGPVHPEAY